jgi:hypothetical protein
MRGEGRRFDSPHIARNERGRPQAVTIATEPISEARKTLWTPTPGTPGDQLMTGSVVTITAA